LPQGGILDNEDGLLVTNNLRGQASFTKNSREHSINVIAGAEYRQLQYDGKFYRTYGYNPAIITGTDVDYINAYTQFLSGDQDYIYSNSGYSGTLNRYISFFGNAAYTYKNKYTISASGRRDASNLFGATPNNRWTPLWSTGVAWDISREKFYKLRALPTLKLRATYGLSGNADPLRSAVPVLSYYGNSVFTQLPIAYIDQYSNPELTWEKVSQLNIGLDLSNKNNRLYGSLEYYYKKGTNLLGTAPVDYTGLATDNIIKNVATFAGHGVELNLNSRNTIGPIKWSSQLNLNFNKDKVLNYYLVSKQGSDYVSGSSVSAIAGKPVYGLYDYKWGGLDPMTGDPQGYLDGVLSKDYPSITGSGTTVADLQYIGPTLPTIVASIGNEIRYRRLTLNIRINGKFGNWFQRASIDYSALISQRVGHSDYALRWQVPGDEKHTSVPSLVFPDYSERNDFYRSSAVLATRADLIRLQYITVSYDLPKKQFQFYINANNLGLLWRANKYSIDAEYGSMIPPSTNIAVGLRAAF
jgi:hypothetical protein